MATQAKTLVCNLLLPPPLPCPAAPPTDDGNMDKAELEAFRAELDQLARLGCQVGNLN